MTLKKTFAQPGMTYRGKPFWSWNGRLEEAEVRRQIRVFKRMGLGGGFMHSRVGLATPYLSEEWFRIVKACIDECRQHGMEAWLYDEDRWPSGAAGGLVTKDPRHRMRAIILNATTPKDAVLTGDELALFLAQMDATGFRNVRHITAAELGSAGTRDKVLAIRVKIDDPSPWYNGYTYLDVLSRDAVAKFIEVTHDAYAREVGADFGALVPGIFTDEPNYGGTWRGDGYGRVPWTDVLPEVFRQRYGYDLIQHLPELFGLVDGAVVSKVRRDYRDCLTHLFVTNFAQPIFEWCAQRGIAFTGHVLCEESLHAQTNFVGSAMRFYEYMQAPGIDILCGQGLKRAGGCEPEYDTAKQCSSVLRQFGRTTMLSELYGCTGWQFTFGEHKAVGDWQAALGVNLRCQHLSYYTMAGQAKRDYPASIFFQSPWWRDYGVVEDYFARVHVLMTQGEAVRDVAVLHPIESAWSVLLDSPAMKELEAQFTGVRTALLQRHFDFDYVDEDILARHGSVDGTALRVAQATYKVVIVPPMLTMRASTCRLLAEVRAAGGAVIFITPLAERVDARKSDAVRTLAAQCETVDLSADALASALDAVGGLRRVSIVDAAGAEQPDVLYMLRHDAATGRWLVFVCHTEQRHGTGPLTITIPAQGQAQEWDAQTGEVFAADAVKTAGCVRIRTELPAYGSRLFVVEPHVDATLRKRRKYKTLRRRTLTTTRWHIQRNEPNAFPLDVAEVSIDGGAWQQPREILKVDWAVRDAIGLQHRGGRMVQPWAQPPVADAKATPIALRFRFEIEEMPSGPCHLVIEKPERYEIRLNGALLEEDEDEGWWIDRSFRRIRVAPWLLQQGRNELVLRIDYTDTDGLEAVYLTGEFGFKWEGTTAVVTAAPTTLKLGNWVPQGLACYSGALAYTTTFRTTVQKGRRVVLEVPAWEGVLLRVRVNGRDCGAVAWPPYEVDITDALRSGANTLAIEIVSSRRNLLGPLHLSHLYPGWTGAGEFTTEGERWTDKYMSVPYGLMKPPVISVRS